MGRNTEIYTFDREKAKQNLLPFISDKVLNGKSFLQFLNERTNEYGKSICTEIHQVARVISEDINDIRPDDLLELMFFFDEEIIYNKNIPENDAGNYGIRLLYELPAKTVCTGYMFQYGNYTHHYPIEEIHKTDAGMNISTEAFLGFNAYIILLTGKILDSGIDGHSYTEENFTDTEKKIYQEIYRKFSDQRDFLNVVEKEFSYLKENFAKDDNGADAQTVWYALDFFSKSVEMHQQIHHHQGRVVILDY